MEGLARSSRLNALSARTDNDPSKTKNINKKSLIVLFIIFSIFSFKNIITVNTGIWFHENEKIKKSRGINQGGLHSTGLSPFPSQKLHIHCVACLGRKKIISFVDIFQNRKFGDRPIF
jgi:hypothetical protein